MTDLTKHNYYKGETVSPENLNISFGYPDKKGQSIVNELLGYGIIEGFEVTQNNNLELKVSPGLAYNQAGERLVLNEDQLVNINDLLPTSGSKTVSLGIKPDYSKTDPVTDTEGNVVYTTWTPTVEISVDTELSGEYFQLASITLNFQGITGIDKTAPKFQNLPILNQRTKNLSSDEDSSTLQAELLKIIANENLSLQGNLINLITQNLQINGSPYIETGNNDNGFYIKFNNGFAIAITSRNSGSGSFSTGMSITCNFPITFRRVLAVWDTSLHKESGGGHWCVTNTTEISNTRCSFFLVDAYGTNQGVSATYSLIAVVLGEVN